MGAAKQLQRTLGAFRKHNGTAVVYLGVTYYAGNGTISNEEIGEFIPDGARNAGNADPRALAFTPSDFGTVTLPPEGGSVFLSGVEYTVARAYLTPLGGSWRCLVYRKPAPDAATANPSTGLRKSYTPADAPT
jgi:hypothetical protein